MEVFQGRWTPQAINPHPNPPPPHWETKDEEVQDITSSLKCLTDYKYKIECQWVEDTAAKRYIPMDLYYQRSSTVSNCSQQLCNRMGTSTTTSSTESHCIIKNTFFAVGIEYTFTFKPKNPISLNKSFRLMENIKLQSPHGLTVNVTETGDYLLSWETIYTGNSSNIRLGTLQYEVNYKRTWESWENSVSETITGGSRQLEINSSALRSADTYVARVRMRPLQSTYRHLWSAWSSQVQWNVMTSEVDSQTAEAEVMPQNLQCTYNGIQQIECTWEVMRESSKYFSFKLHYKKASSSETQECQTSVIVRTYPHLTVHRCNIPVPDQEDFENYEVFLKLVNPSMKYKPYKNIKPIAPYNLTSKELPDGRFQLEWNTIEALYGLNYEINYKKADKSWEDTKVKMIPQDTRTFILPKDSLEPSSQYLVRVRAKVYCEPTEVECYRGPWSDWSLSVQLNTGPDKEIPIIVACILMVLFFILSPATIMLVKRKKRLWLESIPDPAKSRLFHKDTQTAPLRPLAAIEPVTLEEGNICKVVTAGSSAASPQVTPRVKAKLTPRRRRNRTTLLPQ
ncbi:cytokine receptor common subunit beta [Pristis pectinata]|uniref:cytokine receptor common subunit beta n=1 Tax=Pristis pectinata TaxID=685728 RepID=UPI00223E48A0|nr:cytokine receptor common subunit beta [Pristis pectinata]